MKKKIKKKPATGGKKTVAISKTDPKTAPKRRAAVISLAKTAVAPADAKSTIRRLRTQLARAQARIKELEESANTDFLLDIPNRRGFERELHRSIAYIKRYRANGALVALDVDHLKPINDSFGHAAGDHVLKAIVAVLKREVRSSDVIGRLGGDEFALLLWNLSETDARAKAVALEEAIDQLTFTFRGRAVSAGASAGVAILGTDAEASRSLEEADSAMYVRKAQRRNSSWRS